MYNRTRSVFFVLVILAILLQCACYEVLMLVGMEKGSFAHSALTLVLGNVVWLGPFLFAYAVIERRR